MTASSSRRPPLRCYGAYYMYGEHCNNGELCLGKGRRLEEEEKEEEEEEKDEKEEKEVKVL